VILATGQREAHRIRTKPHGGIQRGSGKNRYTVTVFQVLRIQAEERVLAATSDYESYRRAVRWRLVPGLY